jgi:hypothetical protein
MGEWEEDCISLDLMQPDLEHESLSPNILSWQRLNCETLRSAANGAVEVIIKINFLKVWWCVMVESVVWRMSEHIFWWIQAKYLLSTFSMEPDWGQFPPKIRISLQKNLYQVYLWWPTFKSARLVADLGLRQICRSASSIMFGCLSGQHPSKTCRFATGWSQICLCIDTLLQREECILIQSCLLTKPLMCKVSTIW